MGDINQNIIQFEEGWNQIKIPALDPLEKMLDEGFRSKKRLFPNAVYSAVYTTCYDMCTQKSPFNWSEKLYTRHGETIANYLNRSVVPALKDKHGEQLLKEFVKRGDNHKIMNRWNASFFTYLDRYHVKYNQLPLLSEAGLNYFKTIVFDTVKCEVAETILNLINNEREGTVVDRGLIKSSVEIFETMGMGNLETYSIDFETKLLESTRTYYATKAASWIAEDSCPAYMKRVEKSFEEERNRVKAYLNSETEEKLLAVMDTETLAQKEAELLEKEGSGCKVLLINDMQDDLSRMFRLFSRIPDGLVPIAEIFQQHVTDMGSEKIEQRVARIEARDEKEKETNDDPQFVKGLLAVHDRYMNMATVLFCGKMLFQKALKDAFVDLVNRDAGRFKTADLISTFCDRLLKTGSSEKLSDAEVEEYLEKAVQLFSYLTDKDLFAEIYRNQLAKRLLYQRSASDDMERLMISKLKLKCGAQFTAKMEGMLNDLSIGAEHNEAFENFCAENADHTGLGKMEFGVQVLTTGHWPTYKTLDVTLPTIMSKCTQVFKEYYDAKTTHRRLQWTYSLGNATVKGTFGKKSFDFQLTTLQAIALLAFNQDSGCPGGLEGGPLTFTVLHEALQMPDDVLKKVLHSLSCGKYKVLIRKSGVTSTTANATEGSGECATTTVASAPTKEKGGGGVIKSTDIFSFNEAFTCHLRRIRIPMPLLDDNHNPKRVEEDRTVAIEAAVVRIMKARLTLSHQQLVAEVLSQLSFFRPDPKVIKRQIETLIDREYLERDADNANTYKYMA